METYSENIIKYCPYTNLIFDSRNVVHNHTFFEFTFILKGECINHFHGKTRLMTVGDAILLKPTDTHSIEIKTKYNYAHRDVYCTPKKFKTICDSFSPELYNELINKEEIYFTISGIQLKALEQILNTFNGYGSQKNTELDMLSTSVISTLLGIYVENKITNKNNYPLWLNSLLDKISLPENMCMDIEELIKGTNYSHGYLCREFKRYTGKTIVQYLTETRIHYSTNLLKNSDLSIISIANLIGYENPNNYIRNFKEIYNAPPSIWRKQHNSIT